MTKKDFLKQLEEELEITSISLKPETKLEEIEEWDSLATMTAVAVIDEHFGLNFSISKMNNLTSINDIIEIIGEEKFEE